MSKSENTSGPAEGVSAAPLPQPAHKYDPFYAMHLLERVFPGGQRLGAAGPSASSERIRLRPNPALGLPASDLQTLGYQPATELRPQRAVAVVNFFGLYGATSPLPLWYSEALLQQETALRQAGEERADACAPGCAFIDIFNHRAISLLYRAWQRGRMALLEADSGSPLLGLLATAVGLPSGSPVERLQVLRQAGSLVQRNRPAAGLQVLLMQLVWDEELLPGEPRCQVQVEQLGPAARLQIEEEPMTTQPLPGRSLESGARRLGRGLRLQRGLVIGRSQLDRQSQLCIRLGPMRYTSMQRLLNRDSAMFRRLVGAIAAYVLRPFVVTIEALVPRCEVPQAALPQHGSDSVTPLRLLRERPLRLARRAAPLVLLVGALPSLVAVGTDDTAEILAVTFLHCADAESARPLARLHKPDLVVLTPDTVSLADALEKDASVAEGCVMVAAPQDGQPWRPADTAALGCQISEALWGRWVAFSARVPLTARMRFTA